MNEKIICYYDSQEFNNFSKIGYEGFSAVHAAYWKNTTKFAIKKFNESLSSMKEIFKEVCYWINFSMPDSYYFIDIINIMNFSFRLI